ncbi:MAG: AEC family transporter [Deltaproteobacteria bacterium HGW-Deltaproteobacteria-4]|nr:MAG: AEC family transporter [Deltaproteobacteria bacterium HGW-Deltaproteobacteria-4]
MALPFVEILLIVLPVFVVIGLGWVLLRFGLIDSEFLRQTNRLVYYVCLPLLLFYKIATADFSSNFNAALVSASALAIVAGFLISYAFARLRHYPPAVTGAFSQGSFRGNIAYVGLAIVLNAYGEAGLTKASMVMGFIVPVLNWFAILALLLPHRGTQGTHPSGDWRRALLLNPLILASLAGLVWSFLQLPMPRLLASSLHLASSMTLPLALLAIGGSFTPQRLRGDLWRAGLATAIKLVIVPLCAAGLLWFFGLRGMDLGIGVLLAATPTATATYIMADQMGGDAELAGSIIMLSTLAAAVTYSVALFLLHFLGA